MKFAVLAVAMMIGGCQQSQSSPHEQHAGRSEQRPMEKEVEALSRCLEKQDLLSKCVEMGPQKRMNGVWYTGFEESGFVPNVKVVPLSRNLEASVPEFATRLEVNERAALRQLGLVERERCIRAVAIEFIGRQATNASHMAAIDRQLVVVDRLLSGHLIGRVRTVGLGGYDEQCATPAPSEAELMAMDEADMKRCRANGRCIAVEALEKAGTPTNEK